LRETREVELETVSNGLVIVVRGERVARYETGPSPGFRSISVSERLLTSNCKSGHLGQSLSHGNISGVRFGSPDGHTDEATAGRIVTRCLTGRRGSQSVGFLDDMDWQDPAGNTLLEVGMVVRASASSSCGTALDLSIRFSAGEQEEVQLGVTRNSLLHLHLSNKLFPGGGGHIRNGLGDADEQMINGRRSPWFGCVGVIEGETVGLAFIDHPDNPTHPPTWRVGSNGSVSVSPFETCSITLMSNESVTLRFRLQTHSGYVDDGWTSARAAEFAREPLRI
jgi:hypothetical protein